MIKYFVLFNNGGVWHMLNASTYATRDEAILAAEKFADSNTRNVNVNEIHIVSSVYALVPSVKVDHHVLDLPEKKV